MSLESYGVATNEGADIISFRRPTKPNKISPRSSLLIIISGLLGALISMLIIVIRAQVTLAIESNMKIVVVSGGFDPIHSGHISYFKAARELGDKLIVALNSDEWLVKKKEFLLYAIQGTKTCTRKFILRGLCY